MISRFKTFHLLGAIGGFLTVVSAIIGLAVSASYYMNIGMLVFVDILYIIADSLLAVYFFGVLTGSRDTLIKMGSLIAAIGLLFNVLVFILDLAGLYIFALALVAGLIMIAGIVITCIKFIIRFQRDAYIIVFCVFIFLGLLLSLFWTWANLITGAGLGSMLIYFYAHNITY